MWPASRVSVPGTPPATAQSNPAIQKGGRDRVVEACPLLALVAKGMHYRPRDLEGFASLDVAVAHTPKPNRADQCASPMRHISWISVVAGRGLATRLLGEAAVVPYAASGAYSCASCSGG